MPENHVYEDEVSLRDLYLILKRNIRFIVVVMVVTAVIAFVVSSFLKDVYRAESVTLITPPPVRVAGPQSLSFSPSNEVSFESYQTLALSRPVLEAAVATLNNDSLTYGTLRSAGRLNMIIGPQRPDQIVPLSVGHSVKSSDPELATQLADAWAKATVEAVQSSLLASLDPVLATTQEELNNLETRLDTAEANWLAFERDNNSDVLQARLTSLITQLANSEARLDEIERNLATAQAKEAALQTLISGATEDETSGTFTRESFISQLRLLEAQGVVPPARVTQLEALLANESGAFAEGASLEGQLLSLVNQTDIRDVRLLITNLEAEKTVTETQLQAFQQEATTLRQRLTELEGQERALARALENAEAAYSDVVALQPTINFVTQLAPTNARVLNQASVPNNPVGPNRLLNTVIATVVAGVIALIIVFLRAAIADPTPSKTTRASNVRANTSTPAVNE